MPPAATDSSSPMSATPPPAGGGGEGALLFGPIGVGLSVKLGGRNGGPVVSADAGAANGEPRFAWESSWRTAVVGRTLLTRTSGGVGGRACCHAAEFTLSQLRGGAVLGVVAPSFKPKGGAESSVRSPSSAVETCLGWGYGTKHGRMLHDDEDYDYDYVYEYD